MKKRELFEVLEPPPYGWARLSARLEARSQPRWQLALGAAFAVAMVICGTLTSQLPRPIEPPVPSEPVAIVGGGAALLRLPSSNPNVVLYRLASLEPADEAPASP